MLKIVCGNSKTFVYSKDVALLNSMSLSTGWQHTHFKCCIPKPQSIILGLLLLYFNGTVINYPVEIPSALFKVIRPDIIMASAAFLSQCWNDIKLWQPTSKKCSAWKCGHCLGYYHNIICDHMHLEICIFYSLFKRIFCGMCIGQC